MLSYDIKSQISELLEFEHQSSTKKKFDKCLKALLASQLFMQNTVRFDLKKVDRIIRIADLELLTQNITASHFYNMAVRNF